MQCPYDVVHNNLNISIHFTMHLSGWKLSLICEIVSRFSSNQRFSVTCEFVKNEKRKEFSTKSCYK